MEKWGATLNKLQHKQLKLFLAQKNVLYSILKVLRNPVWGRYRKSTLPKALILNQNLIYNMAESTFEGSTLGYDKQTTSLISQCYQYYHQFHQNKNCQHLCSRIPCICHMRESILHHVSGMCISMCCSLCGSYI